MIFGCVKKFLIFFGLDSGHDEKRRVKCLIPGLENGWNNNGNYKHEFCGGENYP